MGFTDVAWESRSTEQLARDLTEGPGPASVGRAGAAWVRVANELAAVSTEYDDIVNQYRDALTSPGSEVIVDKLTEFGEWLRAASLNAAGNGEHAEEVSVAYGVAVTAMPTVAEAVEARTRREVMTSLAAYNGAVLTGQFAELDDAVRGGQDAASAVMYQYEESCSSVAEPWTQPAPPRIGNSTALEAERRADAAQAPRQEARSGGGSAIPAPPPRPLVPLRTVQPKSRTPSGELRTVAMSASGSPGGALGGGYGPVAGAGLGRGDGSREHQSAASSTALDGCGQPGAALSGATPSWVPDAQHSDAPFIVSDVSWGPGGSALDDFALVDDDTASTPDDDEPRRTLEQVAQRWVSPSVIGADRGLSA